MKVIGLTGGIASGKSVVADYLAELGARVIDADEIAHELVRPGMPSWDDIGRVFGPDFILENGEVDRIRLGELVFSNPGARMALNAITHPRIIREIKAQLKAAAEAGVEIAVVAAALLIEAEMLPMVEEVWLVAVSRDTQIRRLMQRNRLEREEAEMRIDSQMPLPEKMKYANRIINNEGPLSETKSQIDQLWPLIRRQSS